MSLILPDGLSAIESLKEENIFIENRAQTEDRSTRKLKIALLNIMPIKETTETDFARVLSYSPLNIELTLMKLRTHTPKHASPEHMERFYTYFDELKDEKFDGFIVTGAPIEHLEFEDVSYWKELSEIFVWADTNVKSTLYICWAAQADSTITTECLSTSCRQKVRYLSSESDEPYPASVPRFRRHVQYATQSPYRGARGGDTHTLGIGHRSRVGGEWNEHRICT